MKRIAWVVLGCFLLRTPAHAEDIFVGLKYPNYERPNGCKTVGGTFVGGGLDYFASVKSCRSQLFATLEHLTPKNDKGLRFWEVMALANLPGLQKGEKVADEADGCSNPSGGYTVAIAKWKANKGTKYAYDVSYAIRWDMKKSSFEVLDPKSVTCEFDDDRSG